MTTITLTGLMRRTESMEDLTQDGVFTGTPYDVTERRQDAGNDASGANTEPVAGSGDTSSCQHSANFYRRQH